MFEWQTYGVLIEMLGNVSRRMESVISNNRWGVGAAMLIVWIMQREKK